MDNNPLRQYFRRPAVHFKLPSEGKGYPPGVLDMPETGEVPVFPMTAIDEITIRTPDALYNGSAVTELIKSCVPSIKDPWRLNSNDLDAILIAIKAAGGQDQMQLDTTCPKCQNQATYGVHLLTILSQLKYADYDTPLTIGDLKVKFRPLLYKEMNEAGLEQFKIQKIFARIETLESDDEKTQLTQETVRSVTELTMKILAGTIEYIETPESRVDHKDYVLDFLRNCDNNVYINIRDHNAKLKTSTELPPLDIKCDNCANEYKQPYMLNATDFFG